MVFWYFWECSLSILVHWVYKRPSVLDFWVKKSSEPLCFDCLHITQLNSCCLTIHTTQRSSLSLTPAPAIHVINFGAAVYYWSLMTSVSKSTDWVLWWNTHLQVHGSMTLWLAIATLTYLNKQDPSILKLKQAHSTFLSSVSTIKGHWRSWIGKSPRTGKEALYGIPPNRQVGWWTISVCPRLRGFLGCGIFSY